MLILAPKTGGPAYKRAAEVFRDLYARITGIELAIKTSPGSSTESFATLPIGASVKEYGRPDLFHTIGLAERKFSDDPKKNLELKKFAYKRFLPHIHENHPNAKVLIATWDFYFRLTPEEVQEIVKMFDPDNTLILDYTVDLKFEKSNMDKWGIMGNFPWIFGLFHGYMPQTNTHGDYDSSGYRLYLLCIQPTEERYHQEFSGCEPSGPRKGYGEVVQSGGGVKAL